MIFGNLGKMAEMMKEAKKMKDELDRARYQGEAGGVLAVVSGAMEVIDLKIPEETDPKKVGDLTKKAINLAFQEAKNDMANKMKGMAGGMNLPGM
jgi:DNA-binding protein YbaB